MLGHLEPGHHASDNLCPGFYTIGGSHASRKMGGVRSKIDPLSAEKRVHNHPGVQPRR